ncbi:MAG: amidohydrolase family protein [Actinomycetales bacterium]
MPDLVITHAAALVLAWDKPVLRDAWLSIEDGQVVATGAGTPPAASEVINAEGCLVLPGFVAAHHHLTQGASRGVAVQGGLLDWLTVHYRAWSRMSPADIEVAATVSLVQAALGGATTVAGFEYLHPIGEDFVEPVVNAAQRLGMRLLYVRGCAPRLEGALAQILGDQGVDLTRLLEPEDHALIRTADVLAKPTHDRLRWACGPTTPVFDDDGDFHRQLTAIADQHGVGLHTHFHPLPSSLNAGETAFEFAERLGLVRAGNWLAHGSQLSVDDVRAFGAAQMGVVHNPSCSMLLGYPLVPLADWAHGNARIAVSVDGAASNDRGSMLLEAQLAWAAQRSRIADGRAVLEPAHVLSLATTGAARAIGWDGLGELQPGGPADLAILDLNTIEFAGSPGSALDDPATFLFRTYAGGNVRDLLVGGSRVVQDGNVLDIDGAPIDLGAVISQARSVADRLYAAP